MRSHTNVERLTIIAGLMALLAGGMAVVGVQRKPADVPYRFDAAGELVRLEATIKSKDRFPDEPGNWAYYSFGHEYPLA